MNPTMPPEVQEAAKILAEWKAENKAAKVRRKNQRPKMITDEQATAIFDAINTRGYTPRRNRAILALLEASGLRISEALALRVDDVEYLEPDAIWKVTVPNEDGCKSGYRVVYAPAFDDGHPTRLTKAMRVWLKERKDSNEFLFNTWAGTPVYRQSIHTSLKRYARLAGITDTISLHMYRHAAITRMARSGVEVDAVRAFAGHSDIATTAVYLHTDENRLREIAASRSTPQSGSACGPVG